LYCPTSEPARAVRALATQRPTIVVKTGLIEEARTMAGAVAGGADREAEARAAGTSGSGQQRSTEEDEEKQQYEIAPGLSRSSPRKTGPGKRENTVGVPKMERLAENPMTARLMVYRPVFTMIPARMLCTPSFVCRIGRYKAGTYPGGHGGEEPEHRMPGDGHDGAYGAAERVASVR
jgi:hypothetical protein